MDSMLIYLSDFSGVVFSGIAIVILLALLMDYWKNAAGLRKGAVLLAFVALSLVIIPTALNFEFKFAGNSLIFQRSERIEAAQNQNAAVVSELLKQNDVVLSELEALKDIASINQDTLVELASNTSIDPNTLDALVAQVDSQRIQADSYQDFEVVFESIEFHNICERLNRTGEFYYTFMINGRVAVTRPQTSLLSVEAGHSEPLSSRIQIKETKRDDAFSFYGVLWEDDGSSRVTKVGEVTDTFDLAATQSYIRIDFGEPSNTVCNASLYLKVE